MSWRDRSWVTRQYESCKPIQLSEGAVLFSSQKQVSYIDNAIFEIECYEGAVPMMTTRTGRIGDVVSANLPIVSNSWKAFTRNDARGSFTYSVVPIIYSIAALVVITWFLTLFVLTSYTIKPSLLLKSSTILSSIFLLIVIVRSIFDLHTQQSNGYLFGPVLLSAINSPLYLSIIDLFAVFLLQINQVQVIMRLFLRQNDKRLTLVVGLTAIICSQIIWAISRFYDFSSDGEAGDILPTFIYLTRTAMAICYAALISVFLILKINYILANRRIWTLTLLTFIVIYGPVAFFVVDVANAFIYELSEVFSVALYVICVVIPWEWCNKFNLIMRAKEKEGVLGRRFYEDELYELDGLELFVEEESSDSDNESGSGDLEEDIGSNSDTGIRAGERNNDMIEGSSRNVPNNINPATSGNPSRKTKNKNLKLAKDRKHGAKQKVGRFVNINRPNNISKNSKFSNSIDKTKQTFIDIADKVIATGFAIPRSVSVPSSTSPDNSKSGGIFPLQTFKRKNEPRILTTDVHNLSTLNSNPEQTMNTSDNGARHRRDIFVYSTKQVVLGDDDDVDNDNDNDNDNANNNDNNNDNGNDNDNDNENDNNENDNDDNDNNDNDNNNNRLLINNQ